MEEKRGCVVDLLGITAEQFKELRAELVKETFDAIKKRANKTSYSCMISGDIHETYSISGKALDELEKELLNEV
jgi:hypothetical protein